MYPYHVTRYFPQLEKSLNVFRLSVMEKYQQRNTCYIFLWEFNKLRIK